MYILKKKHFLFFFLHFYFRERKITCHYEHEVLQVKDIVSPGESVFLRYQRLKGILHLFSTVSAVYLVCLQSTHETM